MAGPGGGGSIRFPLGPIGDIGNHRNRTDSTNSCLIACQASPSHAGTTTPRRSTSTLACVSKRGVMFTMPHRSSHKRKTTKRGRELRAAVQSEKMVSEAIEAELKRREDKRRKAIDAEIKRRADERRKASEDSPLDDVVTSTGSAASAPTPLSTRVAEGSRLADGLGSARARVGRLDVIVMDLRDKEREATRSARAARKDSKQRKFLREREHIKTELTAAEGELQAAHAEYKETLRVLYEWRQENYPSSDEEEDDGDGTDGGNDNDAVAVGGDTMETDLSRSEPTGPHGKDWPDQHVTTLYRYNRAQLAAHSVQGQVDAYRSYELNCPKAPKAAEAEVMESGNCVVEVV